MAGGREPRGGSSRPRTGRQTQDGQTDPGACPSSRRQVPHPQAGCTDSPQQRALATPHIIQ